MSGHPRTHPGRPPHCVLKNSYASGMGDEAAHARPGRHLRRRQFRDHPATSAGGPGPRGNPLEFLVDLRDLLDESGVRAQPRICVHQARSVREQHKELGGHQLGHECSNTVIVAEADLVIGNGVVLVDHRYHAQLEQSLQRGAGLQVLGAVAEVQGCEQHLTRG